MDHGQPTRNQQSAQPTGQPDRTSQHARQATDGWSRRDLLKYGGSGALGLGVLAWWFTGGGPAAVVEKYFEALDRGETEKAERLAHEDKAVGVFGLTAGAVGGYEAASVSVDRTQVTKNTGDEAVVETVVTVAATDSPDSTTSTFDVALETADGEWKILGVSHAQDLSGLSDADSVAKVGAAAAPGFP